MPYDKYFLSESKPEINPQSLESIVRHALIEDIGRGDITTQLTIPKDKMIKAKIIAKEDFFLCGLLVAEKVFKIVDNSVDFEAKIKEGKPVKAKTAEPLKLFPYPDKTLESIYVSANEIFYKDFENAILAIYAPVP